MTDPRTICIDLATYRQDPGKWMAKSERCPVEVYDGERLYMVHGPQVGEPDDSDRLATLRAAVVAHLEARDIARSYPGSASAADHEVDTAAALARLVGL